MKFFLLLLALLSLGCNRGKPPEGTVPPPAAGTIWETLIATEGCLVGSEDAIDGPGEGSCLREKPWRDYLATRTDEKVTFLCQRMGSTAPTAVHTCSWGNATEGELAVYALQHHTDKLWRDYRGPNEEVVSAITGFKEAIAKGDAMSPQAVLWPLLASDSTRSSLGDYFRTPPAPGKPDSP
jgi:hypothetical protein